MRDCTTWAVRLRSLGVLSSSTRPVGSSSASLVCMSLVVGCMRKGLRFVSLVVGQC